VKRLGADGVAAPTERTAEQTQIGVYWGYDGTPGLGTPPCLYNQIAAQIADQMSATVVELVRLLAMVNVAMADAGIRSRSIHPAYAGFGAALFETLHRLYRTDYIAFTFVSDELNGVTRSNDGGVRPLASRHFSSLSQAEDENGQSRIYLGIHWAFDKTEGIAQGRQVAEYVFEHAFWPAHRHHR
jgi:hypothetical protein